MELTQISKGQANLVEEAAINQSACKQWCHERCKRRAASMSGCICKATERTNNSSYKYSRTIRRHNFLAAHPDRIINDTTLVEVTCIYSRKTEVIKFETVPYLNLLSGLTLDTNHDHYYLIQGQMLCCMRKEYKFVVFTMKEFKVVSVNFDMDFVERNGN
ncbi:hypothetical protein ACJMK2_014155 [Sinanodonta woodiana]|uniref:Uncharacterized protein n=1 Tax=Sinanodonta woodiana TaxID=1069815 RepID=A0ABD3V321_SINWO